MSQTEQAVIDHIVGWITERLAKSQRQGLVIGVSGGVDSALTSTLCALTGKPVRVLLLPIHQHKAEVQRAEQHANWLKSRHPAVQSMQVDLTDSFETFKKALPTTAHDDHALANSRSRLRMTALYAVAGAEQMLVCGTGNRVEDFGIGFFTKYGDGGVDISPIAGLMKREVYQMGKHLGIGEDILKAPPTDGLWADGRIDEEQIGASYPEIEWAMDFDGDTQELTERQTEVLALYKKLNALNAHKMHPIPVCELPRDLRAALGR